MSNVCYRSPSRFALAACIAQLAALVSFSASAAEPGDPDPTFSGGAEVADFNLITAGSDAADALAVGPDGAVVLAGRVQTGAGIPGVGDPGLVKIGTDGLPVNKWGTFGDGRSTVSFDDQSLDRDEYLLDVAVSADGNVVAVGDVAGDFFTGGFAFALRLNSVGTPDSSFSGDGKTLLRFDSLANAVGIDSEGRAVVGGSEYAGLFFSLQGGWVWRLAATSTDDASALDTDFAADGVVSYPGEDVVDLLVLPDDRVLVVTNPEATLVPRLYLLMSNGLPDESFGGGDGIVDLDISNDGFEGAVIEMALDPRGRIVLLGWFNDPDKLWVLARIHSDGSLDSTFGSQGVAAFGYETVLPYVPRALTVQSDGKIVVTGNGDFGRPHAARYNANGTLDSSFVSPNGFVAFAYEVQHDVATADSAAIGLDGRIVVGGGSRSEADPGNRKFAVARFESGVVFCDGFESQGIYGKSRWSSVTP